MKITTLLSAGILATAMLATAAPAQERVVTRQRTVVTTRHHVERHGNGWNNQRVRRICRVVYRHHRRVRTCRTVRNTRY